MFFNYFTHVPFVKEKRLAENILLQVKEDMQKEVGQLPQIARVERIRRRSIEN